MQFRWPWPNLKVTATPGSYKRETCVLFHFSRSRDSWRERLNIIILYNKILCTRNYVSRLSIFSCVWFSHFDFFLSSFFGGCGGVILFLIDFIISTKIQVCISYQPQWSFLKALFCEMCPWFCSAVDMLNNSSLPSTLKWETQGKPNVSFN